MPDLKDLHYVEKNTFRLVDRLGAPEIYADGVSQVLIGYPTMKILLHSVLEAPDEDNDNKEVRKACALLTMDTQSALELALDILESCKAAEDGLLAAAGSVAPDRLKGVLDRIPPEIVSDADTASEKKENVDPKNKAKSGGGRK